MTTDEAIKIATRLHPDNDLLPTASDTIPTIAQAIDLIEQERRTCGFNWLTGVAALEALRQEQIEA